jgi:methionyl aminopeptidase
MEQAVEPKKEEQTPSNKAEEKDEEGSDDDDEEVAGVAASAEGGAAPAGGGKKKKKKKKNKKKKKGGATAVLPKEPGREYDEAARKLQTNPPSIPVSDLWANQIFPVGEVHEYRDNNLFRTTSAEKREKDRIATDEWNMVREAAECHRQVRKWAQVIFFFFFFFFLFGVWKSQIKPGVNLYDLCEGLEALNRKLVKAKGLERGIAFPTGVSRNHVAAHYSPNPADRKEILQGEEKVMGEKKNLKKRKSQQTTF